MKRVAYILLLGITMLFVSCQKGEDSIEGKWKITETVSALGITITVEGTWTIGAKTIKVEQKTKDNDGNEWTQSFTYNYVYNPPYVRIRDMENGGDEIEYIVVSVSKHAMTWYSEKSANSLEFKRID